MSDGGSDSGGTQLVQNSVFERFARTGYVVSRLLHLIVGYLAIGIALGTEGGDADPSGALAAVARQPGGTPALCIAAAASPVMALWRLAETALRRSTDPKSHCRRHWIGSRRSRSRWCISVSPASEPVRFPLH